MPTKLIRGLLFRCRHQFTWPRSDEMGMNYQVCVHCGAMYSYDWATMRRIAPLSTEPDQHGERANVRPKCGTKKNWVHRPRRLRYEAPVQLRAVGSEEWLESRSDNVSRAGILIRAASPLEVGASVELAMEMPPEITGDKSAPVLCEGTVVRVEALPATRNAKQPGFFIACSIKDLRYTSSAG